MHCCHLTIMARAWFRQTKSIVMVHSNEDQLGVYQSCKFNDPQGRVSLLGRGHESHIVKMHHFIKNLLLYYQTQIRQTKCIVMMNKGGSNKIANSMTPSARIIVPGRGHISHIMKIHLTIFYSTPRQRSDKLIIQLSCPTKGLPKLSFPIPHHPPLGQGFLRLGMAIQ